MLSEDECHICFERVSRHQRQRCVHRYHRGCLQRWRTVRRTWNGRCFHCDVVVDETAAAQNAAQGDDDPDPDPVYEASPFVRRCPFCRVPFVRVSGCRIMTCICGEEFITDAPLLPEPHKEESWLCIGVTMTLLLIGFIAMCFASRTHPDCVAEQAELVSQCYPCWHKYHILTAGVQGVLFCREQELEPDLRWLKLSYSLSHAVQGQREECIQCDSKLKEQMGHARSDCSIRHTLAYIYGLVVGGGGGGEETGMATAGAGLATAATGATTGGSKGNKQPVSITTESISVVLASR